MAEHRCLDWRLGLARCLALRARPGSNKQPLKQPLEPSQKPNRYEDMSMNMTCHMSMHMHMDMDMHTHMHICAEAACEQQSCSSRSEELHAPEGAVEVRRAQRRLEEAAADERRALRGRIHSPPREHDP